MCAIIDANVSPEVFGSSRPEAGEEFFAWINFPQPLCTDGMLARPRGSLSRTRSRCLGPAGHGFRHVADVLVPIRNTWMPTAYRMDMCWLLDPGVPVGEQDLSVPSPEAPGPNGRKRGRVLMVPDLRAREQGVTAISGLGLRNGRQRHLGKRIWIRRPVGPDFLQSRDAHAGCFTPTGTGCATAVPTPAPHWPPPPSRPPAH